MFVIYREDKNLFHCAETYVKYLLIHLNSIKKSLPKESYSKPRWCGFKI